MADILTFLIIVWYQLSWRVCLHNPLTQNHFKVFRDENFKKKYWNFYFQLKFKNHLLEFSRKRWFTIFLIPICFSECIIYTKIIILYLDYFLSNWGKKKFLKQYKSHEKTYCEWSDMLQDCHRVAFIYCYPVKQPRNNSFEKDFFFYKTHILIERYINIPERGGGRGGQGRWQRIAEKP